MSNKVGRKPYGSKPSEVEIIRRMHRYRNLHHGQRKTFCQIAALLNSQSVRPSAGQQWYGSTVQNILSRMGGKKLRQHQRKTRKHLDPTQVAILWDSVCRDAESGLHRYRQRKAIIAETIFRF